jgi:hypothetical protein
MAVREVKRTAISFTMKHPVITFALSVLVICGGLHSCKKDTIETTYTRLAGKWKLVNTALDDNADGAIQGNEIHAANPAIDDQLQFFADSTGVETVAANGDTTQYAFSYIVNNNIVQRIGVGYDTINYYLASISSSDLELTAQMPTGLAAYFYKRR